MDSRVQVRKLALKVLLVVLPRHPVHARRGIRLEFVEHLFEQVRVDVVQERDELLLSFFSLALCRMRSSACDASSRLCARNVLCWRAFPLASALGSTGSAADRSTLFAGFTATMASSDFSRSCIIGYGSSPSRCGPWGTICPSAERETSQV